MCTTPAPPAVVRHTNVLHPDGSYNFAFQTENAIYAEEQGVSQGNKMSQGQYQYQSPDGQIIHLAYVADETGFHPQGEHLPTPPPIPDAILKALAYIAKKEAEEQRSKV